MAKKMFIPKKYEVAGKVILSQTQTGETPSLSDFSIHASREGIWFTGNSDVISDESDLHDFAKAVTDAQKFWQSQQPKIEIAKG